MMENLPAYVSIVFGVTTFFAVYLFYRASHESMLSLIIILIWLIVQALVSLNHFYTVTDTIPPRLLFLIGPPLLLIIFLFMTRRGNIYIDSLNPKILTLLHIVRIPVELVLFWLFLNKAIPKLMTFEGRNFDVLSGLSAPLIVYFGFIKKQMSKKILVLWNLICLLLLLNIVVNAVLSTPSPFQKFAFTQPNIAILYFPFSWLPCCVVPLVLLSHLVTIRQLLTAKKGKTI